MDPATPLLALSKAVSSRSKPFLLRHRGGRPPASAPLRRRFPFAASASASASPSSFAPRGLAVPGDLLLLSLARLALRGPGLRAAAAPRRWFASVSAASPLASGGPPRGGGGGGAGNGDGGGGGGGGGGDGWKRPRASQGAGVAEEAAGRGADVIVLDVGGMSCGGCAASVKRILESEPQVRSATVNLATEMAVVWAVPEDRDAQDWKEQLGEKLASQLTTCGYKSNLRDSSKVSSQAVFERKMHEKLEQLKQSGRELAVSWALCTVCLLGHISHLFGVHVPLMHFIHSTGFHLSLSIFTFLGPGRRLILDGLKSLFKGSPNMNTLVGLGALSSFAVSSIAAFIPTLGWKTFFEEPVMLIAFVLLGKNLEQRAKLKATSDMTGLLNILPLKARLMVDNDAEKSSLVEVTCDTLAVGDCVVVLPGDRIPADGVVKAGRSTVDESSLTGEPMPVTKIAGTEVSAGSINLNGKLIVEVRRPGGETVMSDIIHLVEEAQTRAAPVQRLADKVAGNFTYGVMALSAATYIFWSIFGSQLVPAAVQHGSAMSLALQLSCSVLVIACPCALGLATPTAVLVGTSLGATRGLLLRGGDALEKFSDVDAIVFDKTGTLTIENLPVNRIPQHVISNVFPCIMWDLGDNQWTEAEILSFAAGVESNTNHPLGKAIMEAAGAANCISMKANDGSFMEEPGSGAVATIGEKKVSVGTLDWIRRHGVIHNPFLEAEHFGQSVAFVAVDGALAGLICFEDKLREDSRQVINTLSKQGISVYMLSGDKESAAMNVASIVGIQADKVLAEVKPHEKKKFISELQKVHRLVAMVGDGINDTAALASADVGIAMGGGVGAASDVSSVVLMGNRLSQVGLPIAAGALLPVTGTILTPSIAGALMGFSSVGVMANSLLLRVRLSSRQKPPSSQAETRQEPLKTISDALSDARNEAEKNYSSKWRST
ncbi:Copper-transporting ATPase PAA1, chloroplastic [Dichanthelium oligosanthes]|uniref:Copper-transporting ATPase PAA1, chloroplastic n=1 Tax=Dichanthelium oligosanthes TaxID=888268 RepID=A0A1E5W2P7_9POAL|nr:Copper-transporting ATPase PAA1, chloroplastic [Dichanthelium oligosanthes]